MDATDPVLTIRGLKTHFFLEEGILRAVDGVDLQVPRGKTLGVVGESGCGKSVTALSVLRLIQSPGRIVEGEIVLHQDGQTLTLSELPEEGKALRQIRGGSIAMIFQEPTTSLSPVHTIGSQIIEAVRLHTDMSAAAAQTYTLEVMQRAGIPESARRFHQYPHQLSGGLRQRAMIAMALACRPALLIADEPTTALDVTTQAQILALMRELQSELGMAIMLITHDLGVVAQMADWVVVMYLGRIVEQGPVDTVFESPQHPYTEALLQSIPGWSVHPGDDLKTIPGSVPQAFDRFAGCAFHPRCILAETGRCDRGAHPPLLEVAPKHRSACLLRH